MNSTNKQLSKREIPQFNFIALNLYKISFIFIITRLYIAVHKISFMSLELDTSAILSKEKRKKN